MKRFTRIFITAALLCTALFFVADTHSQPIAHACGSSMVGGSNTTLFEGTINNSITIGLSLWYNTCNSQNYARMNISGTATHIPTLFVVRQSGPDGGKTAAYNLNCPNSGACNSPGVYSPHNKSQACLQDPFLDLCTDNF